jgi:hypothetical protein
LGKLINMNELWLHTNNLTGTSPVAHFTLFFYPSTTLQPPAENNLPLSLAGSIPTEFGQLINMQYLSLGNNQLIGTPPFAHLTQFCTRSRVYLSHTMNRRQRWCCGGRGGGGGGGGSASGVASGVASHGARKDLHGRVFRVIPTWRTGREEFKVLMKKKVPACMLYV